LKENADSPPDLEANGHDCSIRVEIRVIAENGSRAAKSKQNAGQICQ
jgi:hypothetical protein